MKNIWWKKTVFGIEFFDVDKPGKIELKPRSSNIKLITNEVENYWSSIVENNICIPIHQILICDEDEKVLIKNTTFLSGKIENFTSLDTLSFPTVCQPSAYEEIVDEDVTDFILDNDALLNSTHSQNISTAHNGINVHSGANSNSTGLSSREANVISIV